MVSINPNIFTATINAPTAISTVSSTASGSTSALPAQTSSVATYTASAPNTSVVAGTLTVTTPVVSFDDPITCQTDDETKEKQLFNAFLDARKAFNDFDSKRKTTINKMILDGKDFVPDIKNYIFSTDAEWTKLKNAMEKARKAYNDYNNSNNTSVVAPRRTGETGEDEVITEEDILAEVENIKKIAESFNLSGLAYTNPDCYMEIKEHHDNLKELIEKLCDEMDAIENPTEFTPKAKQLMKNIAAEKLFIEALIKIAQAEQLKNTTLTPTGEADNSPTNANEALITNTTSSVPDQPIANSAD